MKKVFTFLIFLFLVGMAGAQVWNISTDSFKGLGSITSTITVDGLTIYAASDKPVDVDANNKSYDGKDFTFRLKFGGTGAFDTDGKPVARVLSFPVAGKTTITVIGMSSSSSADRKLNVCVNKKDSVIGTFDALGTAIGKGEYTWSGGAATILLYSQSSGINLYYIEAKPLTSGASLINQQSPDKINTEFFNITGIPMGNNYELLETGVYIRKITYSDGSVRTGKFSKLKEY